MNSESKGPLSAARTRGFSLTELLIVVAIVGILAAIGMPMYADYSRTSKRADAQQALLRMAQLQERFFTERSTYAAQTSDLGYSDQAPNAANSAVSNESYWALSVSSVLPAGGPPYDRYTLQAAPRGSHSDPECAAITLDSAGIKAPADCWSGR